MEKKEELSNQLILLLAEDFHRKAICKVGYDLPCCVGREFCHAFSVCAEHIFNTYRSGTDLLGCMPLK